MKLTRELILIAIFMLQGIFSIAYAQTTKSDDASQFVMLSEAVPDAILEIRYYSTYNFTGDRINGYMEPTALLTKRAADSLRAVSDELKAKGYRLKIFDAYRPQMAVDHFVRWASNLKDTRMKPYFYPDLNKNVLFKQGYIASKSGHSRGSTVDLTLFDMATGKELDMGGTFDWFGPESHPDFCGNPATGDYNRNNSKSPKKRSITPTQFRNRMILRKAMLRHGFKAINTEWWHFTLKNEPFPNTYFTFPVRQLGNIHTECVPQAPDYANKMMWHTADQDTDGTGADIFYIVSTWEADWKTGDGRICHYADVWNAKHRANMDKEICRAAEYMAPGNRFYAPFYRHTTIDAFMTQNEDTVYYRTRLAVTDVCEAFDTFLKNRDKNRPLIIVGFSQGALAVVELLKHMSDDTYNQTAAAYVLGYKVTPEDTTDCEHIRAAQGADDLGVTICYNTVKDVKYAKPILAASCMAINPVNWRTDATPATLHDSITVTLSPEHHVLVVKGYSGAEYEPYGGIINVGDIHSCEPWLYSECLKENFALRTKRWRALRAQNK